MTARRHRRDAGASERLSLEQAASRLLEECRTIVPGVQALFGFQLIAVFNQRFPDLLSSVEQRLHLAAIALVVVAMALVMAPAALHRQAEPRSVSEQFLRAARRLLLWGLLALSLGLAAEVFLVARIVLGGSLTAGLVGGAIFLAVAILWFVLPRSDALLGIVAGRAREE